MAVELGVNEEYGSKKYTPNIADGGIRFAPIRRVEYIPSALEHDENVPIIDVKQRVDGQFVVIEKYPLSYRNRSVGKISNVQASLANSGVKFRTIKPRWCYAKNGDFLGRSDRVNLPPIDLGWTKKSKCGSMDLYYHKPGGGKRKIFSENLEWNAKSKVGSLENAAYGKGRCRSYPSYERYGLHLKELTPRYEARAQTEAKRVMHYIPGHDIDKSPKNPKYANARSHVHSLDNINHQSQGGNVILPHYRRDWKPPTESKVGSLDYVTHKPGGGDFKLPPVRKLKWTVKSKVGSLDNVEHQPEKKRIKVPHFKTRWKGRSKIGSLSNIHHIPGGGGVTLPSRSINWKSGSKVDTKPPKIVIYEKEDSDYSLDSLD